MERQGKKLTNWLRENRVSIALHLLVLFMLSYSWMFSEITVPNERSRVYLAVAMVDEGTFSIDSPVERFGKPIDIAKYDGRYFTDKAPGSSFLGAVVYGVVRVFSAPGDWDIVELVNTMRTWLMIPIGLLGFFLIRRTMALFDVRASTIDIVSLGWILGSAAFHYSTAFFGHQIVSVCFILAVYLIEKANDEGKFGWLRFLGAGAALGVAGLVEYQSAVPCLLLGAYAVYRGYRNPARLVGFVLGAAAFAAILLVYNNACFGGPFELSYHHLAMRHMQAMHNTGIAGVTYPQGAAVFGSLLSFHRGLLTTSPFFVMFPIGLALFWRNRGRFLAVVFGLAILYYLLFIFSAEIWYGGWGFGPRLLVPCMGLLALLVAVAADKWMEKPAVAGLLAGLVVFAITLNQAVQLVFAELPETATNPVLDLVIPAFKEGVLSPNLAFKLTGSTLPWTALPIALGTLVAAAWIVRRSLEAAPKTKAVVTHVAWVAAALGLALVVLFSGPSWTEKQTKRHIDLMKRWETHEIQRK